MSHFMGEWLSLNFDKEYLFGFETLQLQGSYLCIISLLHSKEKAKPEIASYDPFKISKHYAFVTAG